MCSNYRPPSAEDLSQIAQLSFDFSECYPGSIGPFLANMKPDAWRPGTFGLLPHWAEPKRAKVTYNAQRDPCRKAPASAMPGATGSWP